MKKIIVLAFVAMMVFGPVVNVLAVDGDPSAVDTIQLGDPKVSETVNEPDFFSSIAKFFDTLIPMVPWALLASVIFIAMWVYFDASRRTNYGWLWGIASLLVVPWLIYLACRPPYTIEEMKQLAEKIVGKPEPITLQKDKVVAIVEYRDGTVIDVVHQLAE